MASAPPLDDGDLLGTKSLDELEHDAEQDRENAAKQARLRENYLRWREAEATRLGKRHGFIARHRIGHDRFLAEVDRTSLRLCARAARRSSIPTPTASTALLAATLPPTAISAGPGC